MLNSWFFRFFELARFYRRAVTRYQMHSPFGYDFVEEVVEDGRHFYAFEAIEALRAKMLASQAPLDILDYGAGPSDTLRHAQPTQRRSSVRAVARTSGSSAQQGERLFRLANWQQPRGILELGTSLGIGTAYLASAVPDTTPVVTLEGCAACAGVARINFATLQLPHVTCRVGPFSDTLEAALASLPHLDLVYLDGNHRLEPTLEYFEACLPRVNERTVLIFDDVHWSPGMAEAWQRIQAHPQVTATIDCWDFACAFFDPAFAQKQHFCVVPDRWKPWKIFDVF
jgi:predicted O-methyltransferase YrrM